MSPLKSKRYTSKSTAPRKTMPMTAPKKGVKVRMYRQGLGDCFLLAFPRKSKRPFYLLIDCGVLVGQVAGRPDIRSVAQHIIDSTSKQLDLVIATHQHWDHLSGFVDAKDIFKRCAMGEVWMAWTENPADPLATKLAQKAKKSQLALERALTHLAETAHGSNFLQDQQWVGALQNVFGFLGANGTRTTDAALQTLRDFSGGRVQYRGPSDPAVTIPGLENVRIYVLGPPRDEQKIKSYNDKKSDPETYHMSELLLAAQTEFLVAALDETTTQVSGLAKSPFDERHQIDKVYDAERYVSLSDRWLKGAGNEWRAITLDWLRAMTGLALALDNATNNTSLALAIELGPGGKVLLFPADAQVGNWLSWRDQSWKDANGGAVTVDDLLARTVLYKVGHHSSHNATLRQRGLELMTHDDLIAMVPLDEATAIKKKWPMPWPKLRAALFASTKGRMLQVDDKVLPQKTAAPVGTSAETWKKFQRSVSGSELFFEITISE
jgi:hypothetical protein